MHLRTHSPADRLLKRAALTWLNPADLDLSRDRLGAVDSWNPPTLSCESRGSSRGAKISEVHSKASSRPHYLRERVRVREPRRWGWAGRRVGEEVDPSPPPSETVDFLRRSGCASFVPPRRAGCAGRIFHPTGRYNRPYATLSTLSSPAVMRERGASNPQRAWVAGVSLPGANAADVVTTWRQGATGHHRQVDSARN